MTMVQLKREPAENWVEIGGIEEIPPLGARVVQTRDGEIAVFRSGDDQLFALANACPHKGGPLSDGIVHGHRVTCPLHNWRIELASGSVVAPDSGCVPRYPVRIEETRVFLLLTPQTA